MIRTRIFLPLLFLSIALPAVAAPIKTESFWRRVLRFIGVSATPSNQKGEDETVNAGDIYLYNTETKVSASVKQGDFRSPVFLTTNKTILAVSGDKIVKFDINVEGTEVTIGPVSDLFTVAGIKKLIGIEKDAPEQLLVLTDQDNDNCPAVGVLSMQDGSVVNLPYGDSPEDRDLVSHLRGWQREYDGGETKLETRTLTKKRDGNDVRSSDAFLKRKDKELNVSRCAAGVNCGQPSISHDRKFILYVGK